jgi:hypothetical protein
LYRVLAARLYAHNSRIHIPLSVASTSHSQLVSFASEQVYF